jgi:hypothetical protein
VRRYRDRNAGGVAYLRPPFVPSTLTLCIPLIIGWFGQRLGMRRGAVRLCEVDWEGECDLVDMVQALEQLTGAFIVEAQQ